MLYVLDTDHLSLLQRGNAIVRERLLLIPPTDRATTIISQTEQFLGWWSEITQARNEAAVVRNFQYLQEAMRFFNTLPVLSYDEAASAQFGQLQRAKVRIGTQDLRIASIALSRNATVVTRNLRDFGKIPGLITVDWSLP